MLPPHDAFALVDADAAELLGPAQELRERGKGRLVTYSPKVFIPLTKLCRDVCHYCTFAAPPRRGEHCGVPDNAASNGVTRRLGYEPDGVEIDERRGKSARLLRYRLSRERWEQQERQAVEVEGVEPCLPLLGASAT